MKKTILYALAGTFFFFFSSKMPMACCCREEEPLLLSPPEETSKTLPQPQIGTVYPPLLGACGVSGG